MFINGDDPIIKEIEALEVMFILQNVILFSFIVLYEKLGNDDIFIQITGSSAGFKFLYLRFYSLILIEKSRLITHSFVRPFFDRRFYS